MVSLTGNHPKIVISTGGGAFAAVVERPLHFARSSITATGEIQGVSPLRMTIKPSCSGRDDKVEGVFKNYSTPTATFFLVLRLLPSNLQMVLDRKDSGDAIGTDACGVTIGLAIHNAVQRDVTVDDGNPDRLCRIQSISIQ